MRFFASACVLIFAGCSEEKKTAATTTTNVAVPTGNGLVPSSSRSASLRSIDMPVEVLRLELYTNPDALKTVIKKLAGVDQSKAISQLSKLLAPSLAVDPIVWRALLKYIHDIINPAMAAHLTLLASSSPEKLAEMSKEVAEILITLNASEDTPGLGPRIKEAAKWTHREGISDSELVLLWLNGDEDAKRVFSESLVKKILTEIVANQLGINGAICLRLVPLLDDHVEPRNGQLLWGRVGGEDIASCQGNAMAAFNAESVGVYANLLLDEYMGRVED